MGVRHGIPEAELAARRERLLEHVRREGLGGYVLFDACYIQYFTGVRLSLHGAPGRLRAERGGRDGGARARVRGRASARRDGLRAGRVLHGIPGDRAPDGDPCARPGRPRRARRDQRRPGRLPRDPRLSGTGPERGDGERGRAAGGRDRGDDGAQEPGRDRTHPRERALVRARAPAAAGVLDDPGRPRPRRASAPVTRPRSPCCKARRVLGGLASSDGVSAGYRGQIGLRSAWAHAVAHNIEFQAGRRARDRDGRADLGLPRRARARDGHRAAERRDAPPLRARASPRSKPRSQRSGPA